MELETVKVICNKSDCGYKIINKKDMSKEDKEFKNEPKKKKKKQAKKDTKD